MKTLIVEDDFTSRVILQEILKAYGPVHLAVDGREAVAAFEEALAADEPYHLVCLDIMMPEMDGLEALKKMRAQEEMRGIFSTRGARVIMTTALSDPRNVMASYGSLCDAYLVKPVDRAMLVDELVLLGLVP
jgi:two-component system chemotaxis response regulator CheY